MSTCVFCAVIRGELPAAVVYEDDIALVILDLFPVSYGHTLIISKQHVATVAELPQATTEHMLLLQRATIAALRQVDPSILAQNLMINDGPESNQHIPHVHWHIIPRRKGDNLRSLWNFYTRMLNRFGLAKRQQKHLRLAEQMRKYWVL